MGDGFVKIYGDKLLRSTVWTCTDATTKVAWIVLLVMADETGTVYSSIPGFAKEAGITVEQAITALEYFASPDLYSQSPEYEGRRIERIDGGWRILNYRKHREYRTRKQVQTAERVAKHRSHERDSVTGNAGNTPLTPVTPPSASASVVGDRGTGKGGAADELAELRRRYAPEHLTVIDAAMAAFATVRKSGKIAGSVVLAEYRWWLSFPIEQVVAGLNTYVVKKYAAEDKGERYARGIIRNTDPLDAGLSLGGAHGDGQRRGPGDSYLTPADLLADEGQQR